jgi:hypothetical protein
MFNNVMAVRCLFFVRFGPVLAITFIAMKPQGMQAAEYQVQFTGHLTDVAQDLNWFNDSFQVGSTVAGTYNFFDSGYITAFSSVNDISYRYKFAPGTPLGIPVLPVNLHLEIAGHSYNTGDFGSYTIGVVNNSDGTIWPVGDRFTVSTPYPFPANFHDYTGDPVADPDGDFFPFINAVLVLQDPSGLAFNSASLPLGAPNLASFSSALGHIYIADGNGNPNYAEAVFQIDSLTLVPEPSTFALAVLCLAGLGFVVLRKTLRRA